MLSRVAERIYWMARYVERVEGTARLVNVNAHLLLDLPRGTAFGWAPLISITGSEALFYERYREADQQSVVSFLLADPEYPGSVLCSLTQARENLRTLRDIVPREAWERLNNLYLYVNDHIEQTITRGSRHAFLEHIIAGCQLITGILAGTMSHDEAYHFARLGRNLERADMTTRTIDVRSANLLPRHTGDLMPFENIQWMSVLKSLSAYHMYRRHVHVRVTGARVLRFLLQDEKVPRAIYHCLREMQDSLKGLPRNEVPRRHVARLRRRLGATDVHGLVQEGLHEFIDELQIALANLHERVRRTYFLNQAPVPRSDAIAA